MRLFFWPIFIGLCAGLIGCQKAQQTHFESVPSGAEVYVDSLHVGTTPVTSDVYFAPAKNIDRNRYRAVKMDLAGYEPMIKMISLNDIQNSNRIRWTLHELRRDIVVSINTEPDGAKIIIDGVIQPEVTPCELELVFTREDRFASFEPITLVLLKEGYQNISISVDPQKVAMGKKHSVKATLVSIHDTDE